MSDPKVRQRYKLAVPPGVGSLTATPKLRRASRFWVGPVWGLAGFVLGIAVWHSLGFWDFVGKTVLKGDEDERRLSRADVPPGPLALRTTGTVHGPRQIVAGYSPAAAKALRACSLAMPSGNSDDTVVTPCPISTPIAPSGRVARKVDFGAVAAPEPKGWSFTVRLP